MKNIKGTWLTNCPVAHRGLWGDGIIENSMPAYENAVKNNTFDTDKKSYSAMSAEYLIKEILLHGINSSQSCKLTPFEGEIIVDNDLVSIGSSNMDRRSFNLNFSFLLLLLPSVFTFFELFPIFSNFLNFEQILST